MERYCPNCRSAISADANTCQACGETVEPVRPETEAGGNAGVGSGLGTWVVRIAIVLLVGVGLFLLGLGVGYVAGEFIWG